MDCKEKRDWVLLKACQEQEGGQRVSSNPAVLVNDIGIPCGVVAALLVDVPADDLPDTVVSDQLKGEVAPNAVPGTGDEDGLMVDRLRGNGDELPVNRLEQMGREGRVRKSWNEWQWAEFSRPESDWQLI